MKAGFIGILFTCRSCKLSCHKARTIWLPSSVILQRKKKFWLCSRRLSRNLVMLTVWWTMLARDSTGAAGNLSGKRRCFITQLYSELDLYAYVLLFSCYHCKSHESSNTAGGLYQCQRFYVRHDWERRATCRRTCAANTGFRYGHSSMTCYLLYEHDFARV